MLENRGEMSTNVQKRWEKYLVRIFLRSVPTCNPFVFVFRFARQLNILFSFVSQFFLSHGYTEHALANPIHSKPLQTHAAATDTSFSKCASKFRQACDTSSPVSNTYSC